MLLEEFLKQLIQSILNLLVLAEVGHVLVHHGLEDQLTELGEGEVIVELASPESGSGVSPDTRCPFGLACPGG